MIEIYRKRFIPEECVLLKDDNIKHMDEEIIITDWSSLKPRKDFDSGRSIYYVKEGYKISEFFLNGEKQFTYCDIIKTEINGEKYIFTDLLVDVKIYMDNKIEVLDLDEIGDCLEKNIITKEECIMAINSLHKLLNLLYNNQLEILLKPFERMN